jgi:hypothetical protein
MSGPSLSMYTRRGPYAYRDCTGREHCLSTHLRSGRRVVRRSRLKRRYFRSDRDRVSERMADPLRKGRVSSTEEEERRAKGKGNTTPINRPAPARTDSSHVQCTTDPPQTTAHT